MLVIKKYYVRRKPFSLDSTCNNGCGCSRSEFSPICGVDGITYYSPCHAGCYQGTRINNVEVGIISYRDLWMSSLSFYGYTIFSIFVVSNVCGFEDISTKAYVYYREDCSVLHQRRDVLSYIQLQSIKSVSLWSETLRNFYKLNSIRFYLCYLNTFQKCVHLRLEINELSNLRILKIKLDIIALVRARNQHCDKWRHCTIRFNSGE